MPKIPGVSHQEAVRALRKAGFEVKREGRKHIVMSDGVRIITIPRAKADQCVYDGRDCSRFRSYNSRVQEAVVKILSGYTLDKQRVASLIVSQDNRPL